MADPYRDTTHRAYDHAGRPYPSWPAIAGTVPARGAASQECQTLKEVRLWRALADEAGPPDRAASGRPCLAVAEPGSAHGDALPCADPPSV